MSKKISPQLKELLSYFPEITPPVTISEEIVINFSKTNKPLPGQMIHDFFAKWDTLDEFTELVPCFRMPYSKDFETIVFWKGSLLSYEFNLATLSPSGELIAKRVIAGTISNGETVKNSVAFINEENLIYTTVGESLKNKTFDPKESVAFTFEILPDGDIVVDKSDIKPSDAEPVNINPSNN